MAASFFVDENDLALGKRLDEIHGNVVYPGHPDLPTVPHGTLDDEWLVVVGSGRLVVITRDGKIRYRPAERLAWINNVVRGFVLTGRRSQSTVDSLALLEQHWDQIEGLCLTDPVGPWMMSITAAGIRPDSLL